MDTVEGRPLARSEDKYRRVCRKLIHHHAYSTSRTKPHLTVQLRFATSICDHGSWAFIVFTTDNARLQLSLSAFKEAGSLQVREIIADTQEVT
jgi:hypothetical protein